MADIAFIFHWPPQALAAMSLGELCGWHARALALYEIDMKTRLQSQT